MARQLNDLPSLPVPHASFVQYLAAHPDQDPHHLAAPYKDYEARLRTIYAQQPDNHVAANQTINLVPVFAGHHNHLRIRARNPAAETSEQRDKYLLPLKEASRKPSGSPAIVGSLKEFQNNFNIFCESSLADLDWDNVVAAGSSVVTSLLPVPERYSSSKREQRSYYHDINTPASDVDLFLYGLTDREAVEKIKQIERQVQDAILEETTTVRTKHAITIVSRYPIRHIQIVLRIYKSVSEILTGFDVDCACAAFDGKQVYATPRALASYMTQVNKIDLSRRSPSYENRLSKYSRRGFEVHWSQLDRSKVDPTIYERSFSRVVGLARLLVYEKASRASNRFLPFEDRDSYIDQRRRERGRPPADRNQRHMHELYGNLKQNACDEVAEWDDGIEDEVASYHTFTIPYGPRFHARRIEKLLYTKDLLLNAEWNKPRDREVNLHRHPAFIGSVEDVMSDCCGSCPLPHTPEEKELAEHESKIFINGRISFLQDDPGRQSIGSFNPITDTDWTEMAYISDIERLCQAIVHRDLSFVRDWCAQEANDPNCRDWTGRTPLHLAVMTSSPAMVQVLIEKGARLVARLVDGSTVIHLAAKRGTPESLQIMRIILAKSEANEELEIDKGASRRNQRIGREQDADGDSQMEGTQASIEVINNESNKNKDEDIDMINAEDASEEFKMGTGTESSIVKIDAEKTNMPSESDQMSEHETKDQPDVFDVDVLSWDIPVSALHLAIITGNEPLALNLVQEWGADALRPIKLSGPGQSDGIILTLVLAQRLESSAASAMTSALLKLGASSAQADAQQCTAFHRLVAAKSPNLSILLRSDGAAASRVLNFPVVEISIARYPRRPGAATPLTTALMNRDSNMSRILLSHGAHLDISFKGLMDVALKTDFVRYQTSKQNYEGFLKGTEQPIVTAVRYEMLDVARLLIEKGADVNSLTPATHERILETPSGESQVQGQSLLDMVRSMKQRLLHSIIQLEDEQKREPESEENLLSIREDKYYLDKFSNHSYGYFVTSFELEKAKRKNAKIIEESQENRKNRRRRRGLQQKISAVREMASVCQSFESFLVAKGAKSFFQLKPEYKEPRKTGTSADKPSKSECEQFRVEFDFLLPNLTQETRQAYFDLFSATWVGDLATIKNLTLSTWGSEQNSPLQVTARDFLGLSPYSISVLRGDFKLASALLQICEAQHQPYGNAPERPKRYRIASEDEDEEEHGEMEEDEEAILPISIDLIDDTVTVDVLSNLGAQVQSHETPLNQVTALHDRKVMAAVAASRSNLSRAQASQLGSLTDILPSHSSFREHRTDLLNFSIVTNTSDVFEHALETNLRYSVDDGQGRRLLGFVGSSKPFEKAFDLANRLGRIPMIAKLISKAGGAAPLPEFVDILHVPVPTRSKEYYKGLSVRGKKRETWAQSANQHQPVYLPTSPLLKAAFYGNLESVEWFLSDTPLRLYMEFVESIKDDDRIAGLMKTKDGIEHMLKLWLCRHEECAPHCAALAKPTKESEKILKYLIDVRPSTLDQRSPMHGRTPLGVAFALHRYDAAKTLVEAGADQTTRDKKGRNLVHALVDSMRCISPKPNVKIMRDLFKLIDHRILQSMFSQCCDDSGGQRSLTPLALLLEVGKTYSEERQLDTVKLLFEFSEGKELEMINSTGDLPLHSIIKDSRCSLATLLIEKRPLLLHRENATGRTPYETAQDAWLHDKIRANPPPVEVVDGADADGRGWSIVDQSPESFVDKPCEDSIPSERMWSLCRKAVEPEEQERGQDGWRYNRRLVSLLEANIVSERLAEKERHGFNKFAWMYEGETSQAGIGVDEVELWRDEAYRLTPVNKDQEEIYG